MASSSPPCIMSSEGHKSTDINWEQTQQESATILNVLSAPTPADISMECTNFFDCSCFDSYNNYVLWQIAEAFLV